MHKYKIAVGTDLGRVQNKHTSWEKLCEVLTTHVVSEEKGGKYFVGGEFNDESRIEENLLCRSLLTLDIDKYDGDIEDLQFELELGISEAFCAYSTFSHKNNRPCIRIILPLSREVTANEYRLFSRKFSEGLNISFDECSFKPNQAMYFPSHPANGEEWSFVQSGDPVDVDKFELGGLVAVSEDNEDDFLKYEPLDLTDSEVDEYMSLYKNDDVDYDAWTLPGFALAHQYRGSIVGFQKWVEWSEQSSKHDESLMEIKWKSFCKPRKGKVITFASIIAAVGGKKAIKEEEVKEIERKLEDIHSKNELDEKIKEIGSMKLDSLAEELLLKKIQVKFKEIEGQAPSLPVLKKLVRGNRNNGNDGGYLEEYVFMTATGEFIHKNTKARMGPRAFDVKHTRDTPLDHDGNEQLASNYTRNKIECVEDVMYVPSFGEIFEHVGLTYLNSYRPNRLKAKKIQSDVVSRIEGHIAHLLPDLHEQEIVKYYLAHNVQHPGKKIHWAIVLQGVQGDGKSLLAELMQLVMGYQNVRLLNVQELESKFTGWAAGQCMTFIEELKLDNYKKYEVVNNIKPYISNPSVSMTEKGRDPRTVLNTTNYFCLTNFKDAIPIDDSDRRWCVLFSQWQNKDKLMKFMEENEGYYSKLYDDMREGAGELLTWFKTMTIPDWFLQLKRAPDTSAKLDMRDLSKSDVYLLVEDAIAEFECDEINNDIVNVTMLMKLVDLEGDYSDYRNFPKTSAIKNILADMGYHKVGRYKDKNRKNQTIYAKDDKVKISSDDGKIKVI